MAPDPRSSFEAAEGAQRLGSIGQQPADVFSLFIYFFCLRSATLRRRNLAPRLHTQRRPRMCFYVGKHSAVRPARERSSRLLRRRSEKHVCMSPCLHLELKIDACRCLARRTHVSLCSRQACRSLWEDARSLARSLTRPRRIVALQGCFVTRPPTPKRTNRNEGVPLH